MTPVRLLMVFATVCATVLSCASAVAQDNATEQTRIKPVGKVEKVHDGFAFTEGPAWDPSGALYFTDIPNTTIHRLASGDELSVFTGAIPRRPTGS